MKQDENKNRKLTAEFQYLVKYDLIRKIFRPATLVMLPLLIIGFILMTFLITRYSDGEINLEQYMHWVKLLSLILGCGLGVIIIVSFYRFTMGMKSVKKAIHDGYIENWEEIKVWAEEDE